MGKRRNGARGMPRSRMAAHAVSYTHLLIAYIIFEGPAEDRNMNTLVDMISGMEVKEDLSLIHI